MPHSQYDSQLDELISLIKGLDTKMLFLQQDIDVMQQLLQDHSQLLIQQLSTTESSAPATDHNKQAKLAQFAKESARW